MLRPQTAMEETKQENKMSWGGVQALGSPGVRCVNNELYDHQKSGEVSLSFDTYSHQPDDFGFAEEGDAKQVSAFDGTAVSTKCISTWLDVKCISTWLDAYLDIWVILCIRA